MYIHICRYIYIYTHTHICTSHGYIMCVYIYIYIQHTDVTSSNGSDYKLYVTPPAQ